MEIKSRVKAFIKRNFIHIYGRTHKRERKIIFSSFSGKQYSDNPRAISEKMHELYPDYSIVWILKKNNMPDNFIPSYVKIVDPRSVECLVELSTSVCYVTNEAMTPDIYKFNDQFFVQTWHGDRGFKKVLYDLWDERGEERPIPIIDDDVTDICMASSDYGVKRFRTAFRYTGEISRVGMPRNDKLISCSDAEMGVIKQRLGIVGNKKILIYAPTFRDSNTKSQDVNVDLSSVLQLLEKKGDEWVCLIRAHSSAPGLNYNYDGEKFINASFYPDMADLLLIGDMLITDYSSSAGDFILRKKPVYLTMFDKDEYIKNCRSFDDNAESSGYLIAYKQEELEQMLSTLTEQDYVENCREIIRRLNITEGGRSSEMICGRINEFVTEKIGGGGIT